MASSFPGGLDNFTNPTASDTLDSATVPHATQHANVNDAVEAIESTLGVNPQGASATVVARLNAIDSTVAGKASTASPTFTGTVTVPTPVNATDAATKSYADSVAAGLNIHGSVSAASTANIVGTYVDGTSGADGGLGVNATFTVTAGVFVLDGNTITLNERILLKNQTTQKQNGIYTCTNEGAVGVQAVFTRATDANNNIAGQVVPGDFVFVATGSQASTAWVQSTVGTSTNPVDGIKIGTDNITFTQFSAGSSYTNGSGIDSLSGGVIAVDSTVARTNSTNTFTGSQTVNGAVSLNGGNLFVQGPSAPQYLSYDAMTGDLDLTSGSLNTSGNVGGGTGFFTNVTATNQFRLITSLGITEARFQGTFTAVRTITVPDASITIAGAGANSDITSLSGLTTALSTTQGGTGSTTATGSGSNVLATSPTTSGLVNSLGFTTQATPSTQTWAAGPPQTATLAVGTVNNRVFNIRSTDVTTAGTLTTPSAAATNTNVLAGANNTAIDFCIVNASAFVVTVALGTGYTSLGSLTIMGNTSAQFRIYKVSTTAMVLIRLS